MEYPGCQLAGTWGGWPQGKTFMVVEPKLDGYRLSAMVDGEGNVTFHCRGSEQPEWAENLGHVAEELRRLGFRNCMVDGEVMGSSWNETSSLLRRKRAAMDDETKSKIVERVRFFAFDLVRFNGPFAEVKAPRKRKASRVFDIPQRERRADLEEMIRLGGAALGGVVVVVPQFEAFNEKELADLYAELIDMEYEGAMVKDPEAPYAFERTDWWLKMKPCKTIELKIVGSVEGLGKHAGRLGALECAAADGTRISVGGGFTDKQRDDLWARRDQLAGLEIEVRCQDDAVATARHPRFLRFREERNAVSVSD